MAEKKEVRIAVSSILADVFEIDQCQDNDFTDDLELAHLGDSLQQLELLAVLEARFGMRLETDVKTFGELVRRVQGSD